MAVTLAGLVSGVVGFQLGLIVLLSLTGGVTASLSPSSTPIFEVMVAVGTLLVVGVIARVNRAGISN